MISGPLTPPAHPETVVPFSSQTWGSAVSPVSAGQATSCSDQGELLCFPRWRDSAGVPQLSSVPQGLPELSKWGGAGRQSPVRPQPEPNWGEIFVLQFLLLVARGADRARPRAAAAGQSCHRGMRRPPARSGQTRTYSACPVTLCRRSWTGGLRFPACKGHDQELPNSRMRGGNVTGDKNCLCSFVPRRRWVFSALLPSPWAVCGLHFPKCNATRQHPFILGVLRSATGLGGRRERRGMCVQVHRARSAALLHFTSST